MFRRRSTDSLLVMTSRAEIGEAAWSELYRTTSRLFDPPEKGKIAVKVINHYGDEVLKVYELNAKKGSAR